MATKKRPFVTDFYYFTDMSWIKKYQNQWMVFDAAAEDLSTGKTPRAQYAKNLVDLLAKAEKMRSPMFLFVEPTAAGIFVPVTLVNGEYAITVLATPDSGAQVACFNGELAAPLGIDISKLKKAKSFEGPGKFMVDSYPVKLEVFVGKAKEGRRVTVDFLRAKDAATLLGWGAFFGTHEVHFSPEYGIKYRLLN
ncbi:hypothetical protein HGA64_03400 [Candidatus Falkowbacteria bacterium]|nr:hypothetical protein [Candidatus Falkowbacteria bacterium]